MNTRGYSLRGFAKRISSVHPLLYMLFYFAMIPLFASLYYFMPQGSFYAPYAHLEPAVASDLERIGTMIEAALRRSLEGRGIIVQGWKLDRIKVFNTRSRDGSILNFEIMGVFQRLGANSQPESAAVKLPASLPPVLGMLVGPRPDETANVARPIFLDVSAHPTSFQVIETDFFNQLLTMPFFPSGRSLLLTRQEDHDLSRFFDGLQGNPTAVSRAFPRMLYFSAIVTTTVGFGDIVPMTPLARFFVAMQAILGIALAGLFLTALARRASALS